MPDPNTAADVAAKPPVPVVPIPPAPDAPEVAKAKAAFEKGQPHPEPAIDAGPVAPAGDVQVAESFPAGKAGRTVSAMQSLRDALKARIAGIRAHLPDAANGDHRATVSALTRLTDLVHDMLGPDSATDGLQAALTALAAGRTDDARQSLEAAGAAVRAGHGLVEAGLADLIERQIATAYRRSRPAISATASA